MSPEDYEAGFLQQVPSKSVALFGKPTGVLKAGTSDNKEGWIHVQGFNTPVIFTSYRINFNEKIQILNCFKEKIHAYAFGKDAGQAMVEGILLSFCGSPPFVANLARAYDAIRAYKGKLCTITSAGGFTIRGIINSFALGLVANNDAVASFSLSMIVLSSVVGL